MPHPMTRWPPGCPREQPVRESLRLPLHGHAGPVVVTAVGQPTPTPRQEPGEAFAPVVTHPATQNGGR